MDGRGSDCDMDNEIYQYFFATEFVDMFPQTNGDILPQSTLVRIGSRKLTSIRTYRAVSRRWCRLEKFEDNPPFAFPFQAADFNYLSVLSYTHCDIIIS